MCSKIEEYNARGTPVAGVVIEPIQGEGGDNHASPDFFRQLQQVCKDVSFEKPFIFKMVRVVKYAYYYIICHDMICNYCKDLQ